MRKNQILINKQSDQNILVGTIKSKAGTGVRTATVRLDSCEYETTLWTPGTEKTGGDKVIATADNNHEYKCIGDGETGTQEPNWPLDGGTVPDGDLFWVDLGIYDRESLLEHVRFYYHCLPNEVDDGHYAFEVNDKVLVANEGSLNFIIGFEDLKPKSCDVPHFFVKVKEGDSFKYYWLFFLNADGDYELSIKEVLSPQILEKMAETPYNHPHKATKAFMMNVGHGDERWVAASHMLTKNRVEQFAPLHYPSELTDPPSELPLYPTPSFYPPPTLINTGLNHPCPPCRFYCNPEDGIMAWYSANPTIVEAQNFIGGIIYDAKTQIVRNFIHYPSVADGQGFTEYWAINATKAELPTPLMFDVQALDKDGMDVAIAWNKRPIKVHTTFSTSAIVASEISSCTHVRWSGEVAGFIHELFATWAQCTDDVIPESENETIELETPSCYWDGDSCSYSYFEYYAHRDWHFDGTFDWYSSHIWDLLGNALSVRADRRQLQTIQNNREHISRCLGTGVCHDSDHEFYKYRLVDDILMQQVAEVFCGRWVCPNALDFINNKHKKYCDAYGKVYGKRMFYDGYITGFMPTEDQMDNAVCEYTLAHEYFYTVFSYPCFYHYHNDVMPDDWVQVDTNTMSHEYSWGEYVSVWERTTDIDTSEADSLHHFQVDENLLFSYDVVDNIYYLDDRSVEKSQGIVAAGRGIDVVGEDFTPIYWKIYWAKTDINYSDVTSDILTALGIEQDELYEIGLI